MLNANELDFNNGDDAINLKCHTFVYGLMASCLTINTIMKLKYWKHVASVLDHYLHRSYLLSNTNSVSNINMRGIRDKYSLTTLQICLSFIVSKEFCKFEKNNF